MLVIETNISYENGIKEFCDHQSRIVIVDSWDEYVETYINQKSTSYIGTMSGRNFSKMSKILNLEYDDFHLSCDVDNGFMISKKLAYKAPDEFGLVNNYWKEMKAMEKVDFTEQIVADLKAEGFKGDMETEIAKRKNELQQVVSNLKEEGRNSETHKGSSADFMNDLLK